MTDDPTTLQRLVGFHEYHKSLELLDELVRNSTQEEIAAYDKLVSSRPEFIVYTNLSRMFGEKPSPFSELNQSEDGHGKRGLAWVMALARLELMAMTSVYGNQDQLSALRKPTALEKFAFSNLLTDGMRSHVWSLSRDDQFQLVNLGSPDADTFAYARRLTLALRFIKSFAVLYGNNLRIEQKQELTRWRKKLSDQSEVVRMNISSFLGTQESSTESNSVRNSVTVDSIRMGCARNCAQNLERAQKWLDEQ